MWIEFHCTSDLIIDRFETIKDGHERRRYSALRDQAEHLVTSTHTLNVEKEYSRVHLADKPPKRKRRTNEYRANRITLTEASSASGSAGPAASFHLGGVAKAAAEFTPWHLLEQPTTPGSSSEERRPKYSRHEDQDHSSSSRRWS